MDTRIHAHTQASMCTYIAQRYWSFEAADELPTAFGAMPPTLRYLAVEIEDMYTTSLSSLDEWTCFAWPEGLQNLTVSMDLSIDSDAEDEDEDVRFQPGPREITAHLSSLRPTAAVLVATLNARDDDRKQGDPPFDEHGHASVLYERFLPGLRQAWHSDPRVRGPSL